MTGSTSVRHGKGVAIATGWSLLTEGAIRASCQRKISDTTHHSKGADPRVTSETCASRYLHLQAMTQRSAVGERETTYLVTWAVGEQDCGIIHISLGPLGALLIACVHHSRGSTAPTSRPFAMQTCREWHLLADIVLTAGRSDSQVLCLYDSNNHVHCICIVIWCEPWFGGPTRPTWMHNSPIKHEVTLADFRNSWQFVGEARHEKH